MAKSTISKAEKGRTYWQRHVALWQASGQRIELYCADAGLCVKQFRAWRQRLRAETKKQTTTQRPKTAPAPALIALKVREPLEPSTSHSGITIRLATGVGIEVAPRFDAPTLRAVVATLGGDDVLE